MARTQKKKNVVQLTCETFGYKTSFRAYKKLMIDALALHLQVGTDWRAGKQLILRDPKKHIDTLIEPPRRLAAAMRKEAAKKAATKQ